MTIRGHLKLLHGGFEFIKKLTNKQGDITYWECTKQQKSHCKGRAHTRRIGSKEMVRVSGVHNHLPDSVASEQ